MSRSKLINHLVIFLLILFICNKLSANNIAEQKLAEQQDIQAKQIIESEKKNFLRQKEAEEVKNIDKVKEKSSNLPSSQIISNDKNCFPIKEFEIVGNHKIYSSTLNRKFIKPLHNSISKREKPTCLAKEDLVKLSNQILQYYQKKGYFLARLYFDYSNSLSGIIKIIIEEGRLEKFEVNDNSKVNSFLPFRRKTARFFAFPSLKNGSEINIRDIEQGVDQFNRLNSQQVKINFMPAKKPGFSNAVIENQISNHLNLSFGVDNSGQKATGKIKHKASLDGNNLLAINDNIYLNYSESNAIPLFGSSKGFNDMIGVDDNSNNRFSKVFYGSFSAPYGYWTLGSSYSYSKYQLTATGSLSQVKSSGNSEEKTYYLDWVLSRDKKYKISLKAELKENDTDSYFAGTYIPVNSRRKAEGNFLLNGVFYFPFAILNIQPKYSKGLSIFGAMKDDKNIPKASPHAQFETYGLYAQTNINFKIPRTSIPFNHKLTIDTVKSDSTLYGSDKFILGGKYNLRGFQESIISGDNGYSVKNDLSVNVVGFLPNLIIASKLMNYGDKHSIATKISKLNFGIFHDYGYVRNHVIDGSSNEGYMSGAGVALNYYGDLANWNIIYSKGLHSPRFLQNIDNISKDNETIYFSLNFNLGFL